MPNANERTMAYLARVALVKGWHVSALKPRPVSNKAHRK